MNCVGTNQAKCLRTVTITSDGVSSEIWRLKASVGRICRSPISYEPERPMNGLRILLLVTTTGVLAFLLYEAITRQIARDAFWSVIVIICALSLNLIYLWFSTPGRQQLPIENKPRVALEEKAPVVDKANNAEKANDAGKAKDAGPQPNKSSGSGLTPNCEKQLRRTADLLRFFANRVQGGEELQSVVGDVRQHEKRLAAVCPDVSDR